MDLGVFDVGFDESEASISGFRGWSGGRRNEVFISETKATNGYLPGKIPVGKWRIIFGLYKVAPEGVEVAVKVRFNEIDPRLLDQLAEESATTTSMPKVEKLQPAKTFNGYKWYRGDLHIHTFHSDGSWTFPLIFDWASKIGLDFVGLTEHNTSSHHTEIDKLIPRYKNLLAMRGEEVTTYGGHINVWGLPKGEVIDFRVKRGDFAKLQKPLNRIRELNLIASINHPTALCGGCDWSYGDWTKMDSVEIWNGGWDFQDETALKKWDAMLQEGKFVTAIGSSDTHSPPSMPNDYKTNLGIGSPTNFVGAKKLSQSEILTAIKSGRVWISDLPKNYQLEFSAVVGKKRLNLGEKSDVLNQQIHLKMNAENFPIGASVLLISNGQIIHNDKITDIKFSFENSVKIEKNSYFRFEIRDSENKMLALTNPIFFSKK